MGLPEVERRAAYLEGAARAARGMLRDYWRPASGIVDPYLISQKALGVGVYRADLPREVSFVCHHRSRRLRSRRATHVHAGDSEQRQRWNAARGLGLWIHGAPGDAAGDWSYASLRTTDTRSDLVEHYLHRFALELLMPEEAFARETQVNRGGLMIETAVAWHVPMEMASARLYVLGLLQMPGPNTDGPQILAGGVDTGKMSLPIVNGMEAMGVFPPERRQ